MKDITIAKLSIFGVGAMSKNERKRIAKWLRSRADYLEKHGDLVTNGWFTQRWLEPVRK